MSLSEITLPSRGLFYEEAIPGGKLKLSSLTAKEQFIMSGEGMDALVKLDEVLRGCVKECSVAVEDLLVSDRVYLLILLRIKSFPNGNIYEIPMRCGSCRFQYNHTVDLVRDLTVKVYEKAPDEPEESYIYIDPEEIKDPMVCVLPLSGHEITYRFLRGRDEKIIDADSKRFKSRTKEVSDPANVRRVSLMIRKVNGEELSPSDKFIYVKNMEAGDLNELAGEVEYNESGVELSITTVCNKCGYEQEVIMPFSADFFRPKFSKTRRRN